MKVQIDNALTVRNLGGAYYDNLLNGQMFVYHIASQALLLTNTTGGHPTVFNPLGSGKLFVPVRLRVCFTSGTATIGSVLIAETLNAGSSQATASAIATFTKVEPKNALRGSGKVSSMFWSPTTNTFTAAPTVIAATGINVAPADPVGGFVADCALDGTLAFAPGTAMSVVYSVTTSTALFHTTILGLELPLT
jgi:hypothetical protein